MGFFRVYSGFTFELWVYGLGFSLGFIWGLFRFYLPDTPRNLLFWISVAKSVVRNPEKGQDLWGPGGVYGRGSISSFVIAGVC